MPDKSSLNHSIAEQSWGIVAAQLAHKADWHGRTLARVNPKYASQKRSGFGVVSSERRSDDRKRHECGTCGLRMDADNNASVSILELGIYATGVGTPPGLVVRHQHSLVHQVCSSPSEHEKP